MGPTVPSAKSLADDHAVLCSVIEEVTAIAPEVMLFEVPLAGKTLAVRVPASVDARTRPRTW